MWDFLLATTGNLTYKLSLKSEGDDRWKTDFEAPKNYLSINLT